MDMMSSDTLSSSSSSATLHEDMVAAAGLVDGVQEEFVDDSIPGLTSVHVRKGKRELIRGRELRFGNG